jgi:hypothetical protein
LVLGTKAIEFHEAKNIHDLGETRHSPRIKALLSQPWLNLKHMQYRWLNGWEVNSHEYQVQLFMVRRKEKQILIFMWKVAWKRREEKRNCYKPLSNLITLKYSHIYTSS